MKNRNFLFLQGPTSPFFSKLGDRLLKAGAGVYRINFSIGDSAYWRGKPAWNFRDSVDKLPDYLEQKITTYGITDIIMLGDTRPVNAPAVELGKRHDVRVHVLEEGYFRPRWLTLEEGGINGHSALPKCPDWYRTILKHLPKVEPGDTIANPIVLLAMHEIGYHTPNILNPIFFPGYKTHRPFISGVELAGWGARFACMPFYERRDAKRISALIESKTPYFILPLQLDSDSQIQTHSPFNSMADVIETTIASFAKNAPGNSCLVIKNHPLDTGFTNFQRLIARLEKSYGIIGRTLYLESGNLPILLDHCEGVITINSTVGTSALFHKCRTFALADPIYHMPGLTAQCTLDEFWGDTDYPDPELFNAFQRAVIQLTQINGGLYSKIGIAIGVEEAYKRLLLEVSPLDEFLTKFPVGSDQTNAQGSSHNESSVL